MKFRVLIVIALTTFAFCCATNTNDDIEDITDFYKGFFSYYNLPSPSQIPSCFDNEGVKLYIQSLFQKFELLKNSHERDFSKVHLISGRLSTTRHALESTYSCLFSTQDINSLLNTQKITNKDPKYIKLITYLNYQAHYDDLYEAYKPLIRSLEPKNFIEAGRTYGSITSYAINIVKSKGLDYLAFAVFRNGQSVKLNIDTPTDS